MTGVSGCPGWRGSDAFRARADRNPAKTLQQTLVAQRARGKVLEPQNRHFFFDTPGYVYSYAFGQLLALAAYARYQQIGEPFVNSYLAMLAAGGSRDPQRLVELIGLDLRDPGFWNLGLDLIDARLREAEKLADGHAM